MSAPTQITFSGRKFNVLTPAFGKGGQGTVHKIRQSAGNRHLAIAKELPATPDTEKRTRRLIDLGAGLEIPFIAAPLVMTAARGKPAFYYLAPFSTGLSLEDDKPRPFPELLEMAVVLAATWGNLEQRGIAHGDIAPANILVRDNGQTDLIDFDNFAIADGSVPPPTMIGQHPMIAPELRAARNGGKPLAPNIMSDRFSWAVLFNILLLGRYPADGLATTPSELDKVLSTGDWPEEQRKPQPGETPIAALGEGLCNLFRQSFSTSPQQRPDAEAWRRGLLDALGRLHVHGCGNAFVLDQNSKQCPACGKSAPKSYHARLIAINRNTGRETTFDLPDGAYVYLGRCTLPDASAYVSEKHIRVHREGHILFFKQLGGNNTHILFPGTKKPLKLIAFFEDLSSPRLKDAQLTLGDTEIQIRIAHAGNAA